MKSDNIIDNIYEYIDKHRSIEYYWIGFTVLALIIGAFADAFSLIERYPGVLFLIVLYILCNLWLFWGRRIHVLNRQNEKLHLEVEGLRELQPKLWELQNLISGIVAQHKSSALYEIEKWVIEYNIDKYGNGQYSRHVSFRLSPQSINIFVFKWGTNTRSAMKASEAIKLDTYFTVGKSKEEHPLRAVPYEYYDGGVRFICLLPHQEKDDKLITIHISGKWEGMFLPLVIDGQDRNTIDIFTPTKELEIMLIAPQEKVFTGLEMSPPIAKEGITIRKQHPSSVIYKAKNIPKGNYQYIFYWKNR